MKPLFRCSFVIILTVLMLLSVPSSHAAAQDQITVTDNEVSYNFGVKLRISSRFSASQVPENIQIILQPDGQASRQIDLTGIENNTLLLEYDLNQDPLKPFSRIFYWYQFQNSDGSVTTSPSFWFDYIDNRYEWKQLSSKLFEVYWTQEDAALGQKIMDIATTGLERSTTILPVAPELPISIYVYPDITSLQNAITVSHQSWVAGHASPDIGVILISDGADQSNLLELERQIPHELMHVLQYQVLGSGYNNAPAWLLEGLATLAQSYPNPDDDRILNDAITSNTLLSLDSMCESLPIDTSTNILGYAQSKEVVEYLQQNYGSVVFMNILESSKSGLSCEQVLKNNTGLSSTQLLDAWKNSAYPDTKPSRENNALYLIIFSGIGIGILGIIIVREIIRKSKAGTSHE